MRNIPCAVFLLFVMTLTSNLVCAADRPPNVVVIFIDDMGYADINPFGGTDYPTPNLDRMANEGRKFTDFVVSSAVCSASRSALLTGCYHRRIGFQGALGPKADIGINANEITLAEICKSKGYSTAAFGKWHLGHHPKFLPTNHGFDQYYGIPYSNDMWPLHPNSIEKRKKDPNASIPWAELPIFVPSIIGSSARRSDADDKAVYRTVCGVHQGQCQQAILSVPATSDGSCATLRLERLHWKERQGDLW